VTKILGRYLLVTPQYDAHAFDAVKDIVEVMHKVTEHYLPESEQEAFEDESTGFPKRLNRAVAKRSQADLFKVIEDWNGAIGRLLKDGTIARTLDSKTSLHPKLVERILNQAYSRTVSPRLKLLHQYEAGTDYVYGELMPKFISSILKEDMRMKSDQVFVDLGSGIGNVVLQAALEVGCESWGCEIMKNYCEVAELQHQEFVARCRLWGLSHGEIHLEQGDFLTNTAISKVLPRADVILVNNQVFTPQLNEGLTRLFLDLKDGCRIVSLKSFAPEKISARTVNSLHNVLKVEKKAYYSGCVSWADQGGEYFISTKDSKRLSAFAAQYD
jgi:[histone H3]-lysine79 N-trimethyltransferase